MVNIGVEVSVELFRPILFFDSGSGRLYTDELVIICMYGKQNLKTTIIGAHSEGYGQPPATGAQT